MFQNDLLGKLCRDPQSPAEIIINIEQRNFFRNIFDDSGEHFLEGKIFDMSSILNMIRLQKLRNGKGEKIRIGVIPEQL